MSALFPTDPVFSPAVFYRDPKAAVAWLERAFGFETVIAIEGEPAASHYELTFGGEGRIMVGGEWKDRVRSPASTGGVNTQHVHVRVDDVDAHCTRARTAGAVIVADLKDEFYGDRTYRAADPEGHEWTFFQHIREVSRGEAEAELGTPIDAPTWT
jgi:uncharacterized glyoxalase superfamily protein PhnB